MGGKLVGYVLKLSARQISRSERLVLVAIANYIYGDGIEMRRGTKTIATAAGLSRRHTQRVLDKLEARGLIQLVEPARQRRAKTFRLTLPEATSDVAPKEPSRAATGATFQALRGDILNAQGRHQMSPDPVRDPVRDPESRAAAASRSLPKKAANKNDAAPNPVIEQIARELAYEPHPYLTAPEQEHLLTARLLARGIPPDAESLRQTRDRVDHHRARRARRATPTSVEGKKP